MRKFRRYAVAAALLLALFWWIARGGGEPAIAEGAVLVIELSVHYVHRPVPLLSRSPELRKAARHGRVDSVVFRVRALDLGWAQAEEIRQAIRKLSEKGRR